jgi:hypothetical protein
MDKPAKNPFYFYTRQNLIYLTARKAKNLKELVAGIIETPSSSLYYHTHHYLQQHEYLSPEPPNDFAYWIKNVYLDDILGEQIASVDLREFHRLSDIRMRFVEIIENAMKAEDFYDHNVPKGEEFHFMRAQTFVFSINLAANSLEEFRDCLRETSVFSIYYHMFESRLRLESNMCDFSIWLLDSLNEEVLANRFMCVDPYTQTLESLRSRLITLIDERIEELNYDKN